MSNICRVGTRFYCIFWLHYCIKSKYFGRCHYRFIRFSSDFGGYMKIVLVISNVTNSKSFTRCNLRADESMKMSYSSCTHFAIVVKMYVKLMTQNPFSFFTYTLFTVDCSILWTFHNFSVQPRVTEKCILENDWLTALTEMFRICRLRRRSMDGFKILEFLIILIVSDF